LRVKGAKDRWQIRYSEIIGDLGHDPYDLIQARVDALGVAQDDALIGCAHLEYPFLALKPVTVKAGALGMSSRRPQHG